MPGHGVKPHCFNQTIHGELPDQLQLLILVDRWLFLLPPLSLQTFGNNDFLALSIWWQIWLLLMLIIDRLEGNTSKRQLVETLSLLQSLLVAKLTRWPSLY